MQAARDDVGQLLDDSPSLKREIDAMIVKQLPIAARLAAGDLAEHGEPEEAVRAGLPQGGFTTRQVLEDWLPDPPA